MVIPVSAVPSAHRVAILPFISIVNETGEARATFQLGSNDDDLSNESAPRTSPASKPLDDVESLKRVNSLSATEAVYEFRSFVQGFKPIETSGGCAEKGQSAHSGSHGCEHVRADIYSQA